MAVLAGWGTSGISQYEVELGMNCTVSLVNPATIPFEVSVTILDLCKFSMNIYDIAGRHTAEVAGGSFSPGVYTFLVDGLNSGVYFIGVDDGHSVTSYRTVVIN